MTKKLRVIITVAMAELMLGGLWLYLAGMRADQGGEGTTDALATIGSTMGMTMGAFLGFGLLLMFVAAKNDRAARNR